MDKTAQIIGLITKTLLTLLSPEEILKFNRELDKIIK